MAGPVLSLAGRCELTGWPGQVNRQDIIPCLETQTGCVVLRIGARASGVSRVSLRTCVTLVTLVTLF